MEEHFPITALLPMKEKSERVPEKNMRLFDGEPLCCRIMETLEKSRFISRIIVNTDSPQIATTASRFSKIVIHERPAYLIGNQVPMNDIIAYDIEQESRGVSTHYLQTHATNPLLSSETIDRAVSAYFANLHRYDALFSVTRLQTRLYFSDGKPVNHDPKILLNTQDLPLLYEENSCIYLFSGKTIRNSGRRIGNNPILFPIPKLEAIDIDTEDDFRLAEAVFVAMRKEKIFL